MPSTREPPSPHVASAPVERAIAARITPVGRVRGPRYHRLPRRGDRFALSLLLHVAMTPAFMPAAVVMTLADFHLHRRVLGKSGGRERRRGKRQGSRGGGRESKHSHGSLLGMRSADKTRVLREGNVRNSYAFP